MKSLDEFNAEQYEYHRKLNDDSPQPNGIACPKCGKELFDSNPHVQLDSNPPQMGVHCECGYRGYRIA